MRALLLTLTASVLLLPMRGDAASIRCGTQLASDGASPSEVQSKCGNPTAQQTRHESYKKKERTPRDGDGTETSVTVYKTIEEWTYNFGPNRLVQVVVFEDGRLVDVRSAGYGH